MTSLVTDHVNHAEKLTQNRMESIRSLAETLPGDDYEPPLDEKIAPFVRILAKGGIETFESCQGGEGHCSPRPFIRFHGGKSEGFKALDIALKHAFPVSELRRYWSIIDGEPVGPSWEMSFIFPD